jgi:hypothetical protein
MIGHPHFRGGEGSVHGDLSDSDPLIPGRWLLAGAVASVLIVAASIASAHLTIALADWANLAFGAVAAISIGLCCLLRQPARRWQRIARDFGEFFGIFVLLCLLGTLASYAAAVHSRGYADAPLERVDRLLGFSWIAWYDVVARHATLQIVGSLAYASIFLSPVVILGHAALTGGVERARRFIATYWVAAILTLIAFAFFPARGPLAFLWHGPIPYMPASGLYQSEVIDALRNRSLHQIGLNNLHGLVCSPSFHTTSAILFIAAAWRIKALRVPLTLLNLAMLLATPVEGTHYLTDMIGGALVAAAALGVMAWAMAALARQPAWRERKAQWSLGPAE